MEKRKTYDIRVRGKVNVRRRGKTKVDMENSDINIVENYKRGN